MLLETEAAARDYVAGLCDDASMARLQRLVELLIAENLQQNLVAKASLNNVWQRHITDSAQLLDYVPRETSGVWLDLGTGAGFPGLVISAMRPDLQVRLVESRRRRIEWLERCRSDLQLPNCSVIGSRLELVESFPAATISARAFAPMVKLLDLSARFSTPDTVWLLPKGRSAAQELTSLPESVAKMFHVEQSRTDKEAGIIIGQLGPKARKRL
jgi:16S rRNA (guanine527-N7)-methyltransferase